MQQSLARTMNLTLHTLFGKKVLACPSTWADSGRLGQTKADSGFFTFRFVSKVHHAWEACCSAISRAIVRNEHSCNILYCTLDYNNLDVLHFLVSCTSSYTLLMTNSSMTNSSNIHFFRFSRISILQTNIKKKNKFPIFI